MECHKSCARQVSGQGRRGPEVRKFPVGPGSKPGSGCEIQSAPEAEAIYKCTE